MIEGVVWDMGGIFQRYFTEVLVDEGRSRGWPLDRMALGPTGLVADDDYQAMSEGALDEPRYLEIVMERLASEGIQFDPINEPDWIAERRPEVWDAIKKLATAGVKQAVLTHDASRWLGPGWWSDWADGAHFEALIDVATLSHRKPHSEPYLAAASALSLPTSSCIFVDDMPVNCRGAEAVGMKALWFDIMAPEECVHELVNRVLERHG